MIDDDDPALEDRGSEPPPLDQDDVDRLVDLVAATLEGTPRPTSPIQLGGRSWRPHVVAGERVVHVQGDGSLPTYARRRLAASNDAGHKPVLAATVGVLYDDDLLAFLVEHDVEIVLLADDGTAEDVRQPLAVIAAELEVSDEMRRSLGRSSWSLCRESTDSATKGRRLEALLAFLLSQIDGLEIKSMNHRTETEEIDIVVRQRGVGMRAWQLPGAPFILVEAKNWHSARVTQKEFSAFLSKIENKRGTVRLGLLVGTLGFTEDARQQELRGSRNGDVTVVFVGPEELEGWIVSDDADLFLEELVEDAMLR